MDDSANEFASLLNPSIVFMHLAVFSILRVAAKDTDESSGLSKS